MKKWGSKWMTADEYGAVMSNVSSARSRLAQAETDFANATSEREREESEFRVRENQVPDANKPRDSYAERKRDQAREWVKRAKKAEADAKKAKTDAAKAIPTPVFEGAYTPMWG